MSAKQLVRLGIALAVLVALWGVVGLVRRPTEDRTMAISLPRIDSTTVDTVVLAKARDTAVLTRGTHDHWTVNGFAATASAVSDLLKGLADTARQTELVAETRASHAQLGVDADSGEHVRVRSRGQSLLDVVVGKRTSDYGGVYFRRVNDDAVYSLHGSLADPLARAIDDWRDKHIVAVIPDSVSVLEVKRGGSTYAVQRSGKSWSFAGDRSKVDSTRLSSVLSSYRDLSASGFASKAQVDSLHFVRGRHTRLLSKSGATLASLAFDSTASGTWVKTDTGSVVYKLDSWTWNQLAPAESTLKVRPPPKP